MAQRYNRYAVANAQDVCLLDLTDEQQKKIDALEIELEKELEPVYTDLRSLYLDLDKLEMQRSPDQAKIDGVVNKIEALEKKLDTAEAAKEEKIMGLLTEDQQIQYQRYFGITGTYGRAYYGRGMGRGVAGGNMALGRGVRGYGRGAGYYGRGVGRGAGNYGRGLARGAGYYGRGGQVYGAGAGYYGRGSGRLSSRGYWSNLGVRYGRGPCGAGLGRAGIRGYGRFRR